MIVRESISFERYKDPKQALFGWRPGQLIANRVQNTDFTYIMIFVEFTYSMRFDKGIIYYDFGTLDKWNLYPKVFTFSKMESYKYKSLANATEFSDLTKEESTIINNTMNKNNYPVEVAEHATNLKIFT